MSLMRMPVNISNDLVVETAIHCGPCPPLPNLSVGVAAQYHPPGMAANKNKLTRTVRHKGMSVVQRWHDIGPLMPHVTYPVIPNPWYVKILPGSSCKVVFAASTVRMNGKPVGMAGLGTEPLPMLTCAFPVPLPAAMPLTSAFNTVTAGLTARDLTAGLATLVLEAAVAGLFRHASPAAGGAVPAGALERLREVGKELLFKPVKDLGRHAAKLALGALTRLVISGYTGAPATSVTEGAAAASAKVKVKGGPGGAQVSVELNILGLRWSSAGNQLTFMGREL